jgi:hypothetical protein
MKISEIPFIEYTKHDLLKYHSNNDYEFYQKNGYVLYINTHSTNKPFLRNNFFKDCIICYVKSNMGSVFLVKTPKCYKGYVVLNPIISNDICGYSTAQISSLRDDSLIKFCRENEKDFVICEGMEDEYTKFMANVLLNKLENDN